MAEIRFQNVRKSFQEVVVLQDLNLTIDDKEFFTFVGPSGCGKSTILNLLAGLEPVSSGAVLFNGENVNALAPGDRNVAMVFQSYALYPHMSVYDNLAFPLKVKQMRAEEIRRKVHRAAVVLQLEPLLKRLPRELSGGQRQRVALGRALIRRPQVFLMDEPLSNLDARLRIEMRAELKALHQRFPATTVYVTHDQEEAMALSDRIAVLHRGRIEQCGPPQEIYERPATLFVAGFVGSPPMNIMDGSLLSRLPGSGAILGRGDHADVVAGIRPTDMDVLGRKETDTLQAEVLFVEPTGKDTWVDVLWRGIKLKGRAAPGPPVMSGAPGYFRIPPDRVHLFHKTSEERLR